MRLCTYREVGGERVGRVQGDRVLPLATRSLLDIVRGDDPVQAGDPVSLGDVELVAPFRPGKIVGIGLNYADHAAETGRPPPDSPVLFAKLASAITGPAGPVPRPAWTEELDYEGELAVVIGRAARRVAPADALGHVFGYAVMDDVSARDRQRSEPQWVRAKGGDGFAPFGPWVTTADEVSDPQGLAVRTWVNGELRQDGHTRDMLFPVAELISFCSWAFTLEPGDVITTGTPAGVGAGRAPPVFLRPGDVVRIEVEGLGAIEHPVTDGAAS